MKILLRMPAAFIQAANDGIRLAVRVQPRASKSAIVGPMGNELKIKVTAPPVDSAANQAVIELIADRLKCSRSAVVLVRGQTSRQKVLAVRGVTVEEASERLAM